MKTLVAALLFLCSACVLAAGNGVKVPPFERVQLGNGAVVLLMERHDVPLIAFSAVVRGGAVSDPASKSGVASLLAGVLQKGAGSRDAVQFAETVASVGGQIETAASTESIAVSGSFLARDQQLMVELLADMLQRPRLDLAQFDTLRARQIEFIRAAKESDLAALTPIYGEAHLFSGHPYGRSVDGSEASLAAIKHADLQQLLPAARRRRPADHRSRRRLQDGAAEAAHLARVLRMAQSRRSATASAESGTA